MILRADARAIPLREGCVQTVVTSPPYWGLRDYNVSGQIGLEPTPEAYVATMVEVFREVRRVLKDDGTVWLNLGDSYASAPVGTFNGGGDCFNGRDMSGIATSGSFNKAKAAGLKPKDLCGIPWRVAFALQADGWYLRSDIIWAKPNPMPESVTDRPTRSHEYLFLLAKNERYFYDADAIREEAIHEGETRVTTEKSLSYAQAIANGKNPSGNGKLGSVIEIHGRNKRSVWTINSEPTPEAHFATFPQKLVEPCILAGTSEKGCCAECGAPRMRTFERVATKKYEYQPIGIVGESNQRGRRTESMGESQYEPIGWRPSCAHETSSVPCLVFDPFGGSMTVGRVAERLGRRWVALELSEQYIDIGRRRTAQMGLML